MRHFLALVATTLSVALSQESSVVSLSNGVQLRITATTTPADSEHHLKSEFEAASGNSVYRIFRDDTGLAVYAYELVVDRLADGTHFQIAANPAGVEFAAKFPNADGGKPTPTLSQSLQSPALNSGGRFTVEIPTNPGWFEHRTDTVQIGLGSDGSGVRPSTPLLRFAGLKVSVNNMAVPIHDPGAVVSGRYVMFYIPDKGGYFFSTELVTSRPFIQAGVVDGTRLKLHDRQRILRGERTGSDSGGGAARAALGLSRSELQARRQSDQEQSEFASKRGVLYGSIGFAGLVAALTRSLKILHRALVFLRRLQR